MKNKKREELEKLESQRDAIDKKIEALKKSTGQLEFEDYIRDFNTYTSFSSTGEYSISVNNIQISLPSTANDLEIFYKNMLIALKALNAASYGSEHGVIVQ